MIAILLLSSALSLSLQEEPLRQAERLFAGRDNVAQLRQAISLLEDLLARNPSSPYEVLWRLAKYRYYLSLRQEDASGRLRWLEAGIEAAKKAVALDGERPEGHFWLGATYGDYAELKGAFKSLRLVRTIRREFEAAWRIAPAYENGNVYLALGEMDLRLPRLLGGNQERGMQRLEKGLEVGPTNAELKLALAGYYLRSGRKEEARRWLESILRVADPARTPREQKELRNKAHRLLEKAR
ncbi:MAG: tetratricopeptide repeat protein [Candidatus Tectomicrobia bacterium]|uniref:Tetratricopeptide repeat protein n=1 Tax=Tectimicrobiota bacterium TaxID=2528274 RepID=A0A932CQ40_UNCTE|nr:tetratricopeptide repeat protein [Candidatus Tectomicrobia bacterium]